MNKMGEDTFKVDILREKYLSIILQDTFNGILLLNYHDFEDFLDLHGFSDAYSNIQLTVKMLCMKNKCVGKVKEVRFINPSNECSLRGVSSETMMNQLIAVKGIITRAGMKKPMVAVAGWVCKTCDSVEKIPQRYEVLNKPISCSNCGKSGPWIFKQESSTFIDMQDLQIQECPEDLPAGNIPRVLNVRVFNSLIDSARAGDIVTVIGVLKTRQMKPDSKVLDIYIEANNVIVYNKDLTYISISKEAEDQIKQIAAHPECHEYVIDHIAPSIYGHKHIKEAIMYTLFGGVKHEKKDITVRGEIHILLIGDAGTAKSQLLLTASQLAPRALYASGKGSTAAGLTAAVVKADSGGWALEVGALILADKGLLCLDEADKMRDEDRSAIHSAMEQSCIPINKAGINTILNARTSILAAANPKFGRYITQKPFSDNVNLSAPILSRFDLIFLLLDRPEEEQDTAMGSYILGITKKPETMFEELPKLTDDLFKKYVIYARKFKPKVTREVALKMLKFYLEMRGMSDEDNPRSITPRQLESLKRLTEARARIALREECIIEDVEAAINIMKRHLCDVGLSEDGGINIEGMMSGISNSKKKSDVCEKVYQKILASRDGISHRELSEWASSEEITGSELHEILYKSLWNKIYEDEGIWTAVNI